MIFSLGTLYTFIYWQFSDFAEWYVQLYTSDNRNYTPISLEHMPTILIIDNIAIASFLLLRFWSKKLSPIIASLCLSAVFLGIALSIVFLIQNIFSSHCNIMFTLFPINYIICSIRLMMTSTKTFAQRIKDAEYNNKFLQICQRFLNRSSSFLLISFLLSIPLLIIIIIILLLFGQQPDSIVKAFTETAEWSLSQKIPPPRIESDGHYLCTVAACGDEKVVKPIRAGKRHGNIIVVNRQLLVANAFEDLIAKRTPRLHKIVRSIYDKSGLPISKYITTKRRSNIVYYIMKPLEWFFVLVLYTFDTTPENRIHSQYIS